MTHSSTVKWILALICLSSLSRADETKEPDFLSPQIVADGKVVFRYFAPKATSVAVQGLRRHKPVPMSRDSSGLWSVTISGLAPDIYTYSFNVDGATALDPKNRFFKRWIRCESAVEVPGPVPADYALQPVPHGVLHHHTYASRVIEGQLSFAVYTPPGYNSLSGTSYPVVFLLHGFGDDETDWANFGRANSIADNLIAKELAKRAVIVMPYGHAVPPPESFSFEYADANELPIEKIILTELLPQVQAFYSVSRRPRDRAIVGLSMGGSQALSIGLNHPEVFQWVGAFSAAVPASDFERRFPLLVRSGKERSRGPKLLWIALGRGDQYLEQNTALTAWFTQKKIPFAYKVTDGGHEWTNWRAYLGEFLQKIFR